METLKKQITELEEKISNTSNPYKIKSLKEQLSWLKSELKGQFVTKDDLTELKGLIIFVTRKSLYFNTPENLKEVMNRLLEKVESNGIVYRTQKGIKGLVIDQVKRICKDVCMDDLINRVGKEVLNNGVERERYYRPMEQFYLNVFM